ncbi:LutC/YkgG family protein [Desulfoplanes sp.]
MSEVIQQFQTKAEAVSAIVSSVPSLDGAFAYTVDLCANKEACQILASGCEEDLSAGAEDLCELKEWGKIIAAPGLAQDDLDRLVPMAREQGISVIREDMRKQLGGIDIGLTLCDYGIAETGTLVLDSSSEELRLATMISEVHVAVIPASKIKGSSAEIIEELETMMQNNPNYLAFITGASRTADIERVLALGVHGPLELHILILEDM